MFWLLSVACKLVAIAGNAPWEFLYTSTFTHVDGLAVGAWIAAQKQNDETCPGSSPRFQHVSRWIFAAGIAAVLVLALVFLTNGEINLGSRPNVVFVVSAASIAFGALIYAAVTLPSISKLNTVLSNSLLTYLGRRSYSLYLVHWVLFWQIWALLRNVFSTLPADLLIAFVGICTVTASLVVTEIMYRGIEQPFLRLKKRWL
jgi:peptidoglycan/LPS O-acetylase OafA/YrhL